jgi:predicted RNase H-like nuclease (RuvC/YqgF family)
MAGVSELLLQEAQQECAALRADLYQTRRIAEERRQHEQTLTKANQELTAQVQSLTARAETLGAEAGQVPGLRQALEEAQHAAAQLRKDLDTSIRARRILEGELASA